MPTARNKIILPSVCLKKLIVSFACNSNNVIDLLTLKSVSKSVGDISLTLASRLSTRIRLGPAILSAIVCRVSNYLI